MDLIILNIQNWRILYNQMRYRVEVDSKTPAYMQLYTELRDDITDGVYSHGEKLPSKRTLCAEAGVSVITAEHALAILCDEGYAEARQRSGYYVIYKKDDFISSGSGGRVREAAPSHGGTGDFPFSVIAKTMRRVLSDRGEDIMTKSPNRGVPELREAVASYLQRSNGMRVNAGQIVIGAGAEYLYGLLLQLLGTDRIYATEDPCYDRIRSVYGAHGVTCEALPLGDDGITPEALSLSRASVLHITPFHSYPSGVTASASKRREYLAFARRRGGYIIEDNYDSELTVSHKNEETVFSLSDDGRVIYVNTFSMTVAPSIRVGYAVLPPELSLLFDEKLGFYSCTVPVFEQYVLCRLIENGDFERNINRIRRKKRKAAAVN